MQIKHNIQSSASIIRPIDVDVDTVYLSYDVQPYTGEHDGINWVIGTMAIIPLREYIEGLLQTETGQLITAENTAETLEAVSFLNEQQKIEQAQSNAELIELILSLQGGK